MPSNMTTRETALLHLLVENLGGHSVHLVNPADGRRLGYSTGRRSIALRDVLALADSTRPADAPNPSPVAKEGGGAEAILWQEKRGIWKRPGATVKHVRMSSGHMAWRATFDDGRHHHSDSADDAKAYADGFLAREQAEAFSTPTEGPASQTEGMGGDAAREIVADLERSAGKPLVEGSWGGLALEPVARAIAQDRAAAPVQPDPEAVPVASFGALSALANELSWNHKTRAISDRIRAAIETDRAAALTPPETAEAVPPLYLIRKGGAFYRPNSQGYTRSIAEAGRYSLAEAEAITHPNGPNGPRDGMDYIPAPATASDPAPATDDREKLVEALRRSAQGWANVIELGLLPAQHVATAQELHDDAHAALATEASR